ncbi:invasion associated locus B family protein [Paracoccus rhizosphaerae]|uniref:Invasion associated locus B family protein n=1 Tax=Paracoccus rhizosphaerae TaxID=1133347 RepID=A0ABV6CP26_9RHOB|nr:invasion associated locus B family protein [Paracoccus rhizosphaerae]
MSIKSSHAVLAALALMAAPAFAQEAATPMESPTGGQPAEAAPADTNAAPAETTATDAAGATTPAAEAEGEDTADAAAPAENADQTGSYYLKSEHGDWAIRCIRAGQGKDPCELYKLLTDDDDSPVAELTLIPLANGEVAAGATLVAPLETDLIAGLGFQVDNGERRGYPFSFCAPVGCIARLGFTEQELTGMKRGATASVELLPFGGDRENPVDLDFSLSGFTAAFDELAAYAAAPAAEAEDATPAETESAPAE